MTKQLLNLHTIQKITLILTTLLLLLPSTMRAEKYDTTEKQVRSMSGGTNVHYGWDVNNGNKWNISYENNDVTITGGQTTLQFTINAGKTMTLSTSKPDAETGNLRKVTLNGIDENLSTTVSFGSENLKKISNGIYAFDYPEKWNSEGLTITISNNTEAAISCTISSIIILTGKNYVFDWGNLTAVYDNDISGITKSGNDDAITLEGHCEAETKLSLPIVPRSEGFTHTISYTSNNEAVAVVDNEGTVTIKGAGEATITATPQETDNQYYSPSSYSYTINITNLDEYCGLKVAGIRVTTGNKDNILNDIHKSISYNPGAYTLTLKGAEIKENCDAVVVEDNNISKLTAHIIGHNKIGRDGYKCFYLGENSTLEITTSDKLPGYIQYYGTFVDDMEKVQLPEGFKQVTGEVNEIGKISENTSISPFTGRVEYITSDSEPIIYTGISSSNIYNSTDYYASNATLSGNTVIVSSQGGTTATLRPSNLYDIDRVQKVTFQFDWGTCTNKNVTVQIRGMKEDNQTWSEDGNNYSEAISLNTADKDGIIEIPLTKAITSDNIELYFSSDVSFSFVPLTIAMSLCENYDIGFCNKFINKLNKNDVFGDGTVSYDPDGNTLTLKGANLTPDDNADFPGFFYTGDKTLNVKLVGDNSMSNAFFAYDNEVNPNPQIRFYTEADKPGSLVMVNNQLNNSSSDFTDVKDYFVGSYSVVYDNTYYSYSSYQSYGGDFYTGTYTISTLRPVISSYYSDGNTIVNISVPSDQATDATIKYSVTYADGSDGITNATYSDPFIVNKAATITSYLIVGGKNSSTTTAYRFLPTPNSIKLTYGAEEPTYTYTPQIQPVVEGVQVGTIVFYDYFGGMDGEVFYGHCVGKGTGTINLVAPDIHDYVILNDTIGFTVEILPEKPTFSLADDKTYNNSQTITLTSPFSGVEELCEDVSIKYYLGETEPETASTYSGPITIDSSTKLTAWVEAVVTLDAPQTETFKSEKVTKEYSIVRNIADATVTLENGNEFTYSGAKCLPTIESVMLTTPSVSLTAGTDYDISYTKGGEAIDADNIINAGEYKMVLTGKGNFTGTKEVDFTINPRPIESMTFSLSATSFTYNAQAQKPTVTLQYDDAGTTKTIPATDYDLTYSGECINAGTYSVSASLKGNYSGSADGPSFTITQATISAVTLEKTQLSWTGEEQTVGVSAVKAGDVDVPSTDYTISGNKGKEPGTYTVNVTAKEDGNFKGSATAQFSIDGGYMLWVGNTLVTPANKDDVLGDNGTGEGDEKRLAPSFVFNSDDNTLLIIKSEAGLTIESRLPELKIHITGNNKLKAITFNNQGYSENTGTLMFTCDSNKPGVLDIENDEGKNSITGFMSVTFDESSNLCIRNGATTASSITIGTPLNPLTDNGDGTLNPDDFTTTNPDGTTQTADLTNTNINDILYTLPETTEGQGYNPEDNSISIVTPMSDNEVEKIIAAAKEQTVTVGSSDYAAQYLGITFLISGGKGDIIIDQEAVEGYEFHLKIGDGKPVTLGEGTAGRLKVTIEYEVPDATYCWLYLVQKTAGSRGWGNTRVGKRDHAHGHIHSVSIKAKSVSSSNSASKASGGTISVETNAAITGIEEVKTDTERAEQGTDKTDERWYTMDGRRIDKPTQKGLYIRNRKKVVIK